VLAQALSLSGLGAELRPRLHRRLRHRSSVAEVPTAVELRDAAMAKFDTAITMAGRTTFSHGGWVLSGRA